MIDDARIGRIVSHGGGYPGFGSHMRWHPASGLGVIALANHRYAPATLLARDQLWELVQGESAPVRRTRPTAATEVARAAVEALIADWDDDRAAELFAMNVDLDEPLATRKATIDRIRARHGALRLDPSEPQESHTSFHLAWWLVGDKGGRVRVEILLTPELPPKVQTLAIRSVPEPVAALLHAAERIVAAIGGEPRPGEATLGPVMIDWPSDVVAAHDLDVGPIVRAMRATEARFAPIRLGPVVDGDAERKSTFRLRSDRGSLDLALGLDPDLGCITAVSLVPVVMEPPDLD
jgi:serine-type D-Ala-D-Ala carboxypeptidase/endopeptidase